MDTLLNSIVIMKYGVHASEGIQDIIERKEEEIRQCGKMFWGYGGVICHPLKQVQPFLVENLRRGIKTYLLLSETSSKLWNAPSVATQYSIDGEKWFSIPDNIKVLGSKYAIVCKDMKHCCFDLDLNQYIVPLGNSINKRLSEYMKGRVDKACGYYKENKTNNPMNIRISLYAEIVEPFSVFCR